MNVYQHTFTDPSGRLQIFITPDNPEAAERKFASWVGRLTHVESVATTLEAYYESLLMKHDFYYHYSDDHSVYKAGEASMSEISRVRKLLDRDVELSIWNSVIDRKGWGESVKNEWRRK